MKTYFSAILLGLLAVSAVANADPGLILYTATKGAPIDKAWSDGSTLKIRDIYGHEETLEYFPDYVPFADTAKEVEDFINAGNSISVASCLNLERVDSYERACHRKGFNAGTQIVHLLKMAGTDCGAWSSKPLKIVRAEDYKWVDYSKESIYFRSPVGSCMGPQIY